MRNGVCGAGCGVSEGAAWGRGRGGEELGGGGVGYGLMRVGSVGRVREGNMGGAGDCKAGCDGYLLFCWEKRAFL